MIGLAGSHRTGKTTLAREYAARAKIPFVQTDTTGVFAKMGFDPKVDYPMNTRLLIQNEILNSAEALYAKGGVKFITDRTPIDMMAYTLADVQRNNISPVDGKALLEYMHRCFQVTNRHFTVILIVQPGIAAPETEGKAPSSEAYMEHMNVLCKGLVVSDRMECNQFVIPRQMLDLEKRIEAVEFGFSRSAERFKLAMGDLKLQGIHVH